MGKCVSKQQNHYGFEGKERNRKKEDIYIHQKQNQQQSCDQALGAASASKTDGRTNESQKKKKRPHQNQSKLGTKHEFARNNPTEHEKINRQEGLFNHKVSDQAQQLSNMQRPMEEPVTRISQKKPHSKDKFEHALKIDNELELESRQEKSSYHKSSDQAKKAPPASKTERRKSEKTKKGPKQNANKFGIKSEISQNYASAYESKSRHEGLSYYMYNAGDQTQQQLQLQRPMEESKQMLYDVFGNCITILEEFEQRELATSKIQHNIPRSDIYIPDQTYKTTEDIKSIVECQLLLFETQTKTCPPRALEDLRVKLRCKTISWVAVREEMGIKKVQQTDRYITKLYEILAKGSTNHLPIVVENISQDDIRSGVQAILYGEHDLAKLDREFKKNPNKESICPNTRRSEMIQGGAERIMRAHGNQDLVRYLEDDVIKAENDGPEDLR